MQLFGGQKPPCWWAKCMAFPIPLANSQPVHLPVDSHQLFRTIACSSRSECTRYVVFSHLQFHPCVASLPGYSERLASEKKATHLVHSDLLEQAMVRKSWCESTGRCTGCKFARAVGNAIHFAHQQGGFCPPNSCISGPCQITP